MARTRFLFLVLSISLMLMQHMIERKLSEVMVLWRDIMKTLSLLLVDRMSILKILDFVEVLPMRNVWNL